MKLFKVLSLAVVLITAAACSEGGKLAPDKKYGFKYPTNCVGDKAVWWEMHENRICEEPVISTQQDGDYYYSISYQVKLDLRNCGFLAINDYFNQLFAAGYQYWEYTPQKLEDFFDESLHFINCDLQQQAEPYETWGVTAYKTGWGISLSGTRRDVHNDDNPSLIIIYEYYHTNPDAL